MVTPFSSIYASLITPLRTAEVIAIAPLGTLIRWDTEYPALIDDRQVGDLPSLELMVIGGAPVNLNDSSDGATVDMLFELTFRTDQEKLTATLGLFNLFWAVLRALFTAGTKLGNSYITSWDITSWEPLGPLDPQLVTGFTKKSEQGWQSTMQILVNTQIPHSELIVT